MSSGTGSWNTLQRGWIFLLWHSVLCNPTAKTSTEQEQEVYNIFLSKLIAIILIKTHYHINI